MSSVSIPLGPFELHEPIGKGGMGEVFRGVHVGQQVPVAVKVLAGRFVENRHVQEAFRNEVRSAARLHHRNIVMLFDQGRVSRKAAPASDDRLKPGSPYLAMELVTGGTLDVARRVLDWKLLRELLLDILDALAHAHARGVVHRDLKPANVLLAGEADFRQGIKITDFGIARALEVPDDANHLYDAGISGTLRYMAPEQIAGLWRDEGPWTDLYALGVIAYRFASEKRPFGDADGDELMHCHLHATPAPFEPVYPVPAGFRSWIERLLAKRPANRFERAADAALALKSLSSTGTQPSPAAVSVAGTVGSRARPEGSIDSGDETNLEFAGDPWIDADGDTAAGVSPDGDTGDTAVARANPKPDIADAAAHTGESITPSFLNWWEAAEEVAERAEVPPLPQSWRRPPLLLPSMRLVGAGLGLYGLRPIPFVARDGERNLLWHRLHEVARQRRPRILALHGEAGCGKSRLVEWISQRAHELGGATVLRATHSPIAGPADGLPRMLANHLRSVGLERILLIDRCRRFTNEHPLPRESDSDLAATELAEIISPHGDASRPPSEPGDEAPSRVRFANPAERYRAARRVLERLGRRRPLLLWLDDVHWGSDAIAFAESMLTDEDTSPLPVLVLMTYHDDLLADRPVERAQLEQLWSQPDAERVEIKPLEPADHVALVQRLLGLAEELVERVVERTAGNPLFAVQLIGDWVQRGVLEVSEHGFDVKANESAGLPDDIHDLCAGRVHRIAALCVDATLDDTLASMEVAATLGQDVSNKEWQHACEVAALSIPADLLHHMLSHRLAIATDETSWSFAHSMLRESLERQAREIGRLTYLHRACAEMLAERYRANQPAVAERRGRHLVAAGDLEAALEPLLQGAEHRRLTSDFRLAHALYEEREAAMSARGLPEEDPRWGEGWVRRARAYVPTSEHEEATELANHALECAERFGWTAIAARAHSVRGDVALGYGDTNSAHAAFQRAVELFRKVDDPSGFGDALVGLGGVCRWRGELEEATRHYDAAYALQERSGDHYELALILRGMANLRHSEGEDDEAERLLEQARAHFERNGNRFRVASCLNDLGEIARKKGDLEKAEALYRQSGKLYAELGCADASTPRFNLGLVLLQEGRYSKARTIFDAELRKLAGEERSIDKLWLHAGLLPCLASALDWAAWDHHLARISELLEDLVDEDIPWCAELAARIASVAGEKDRGKRAYELARSQWERMNREEDLARVEKVLAKLASR